MRNLLLFICLFLTCFIFCQNYAIDNHKIIASKYNSYHSVNRLSDGGYLFTATTLSGIFADKTSPQYGYEDVWIVKTDNQFNILWQKAFGGSFYNFNESNAIETPEGDLLIGVTSGSPVSHTKIVGTNGKLDYWLIKLKADGTLIWQKNYGGAERDFLKNITLISNTKYVLSGYSESSVSGNKSELNRGISDYWIVMVDRVINHR